MAKSRVALLSHRVSATLLAVALLTTASVASGTWVEIKKLTASDGAHVFGAGPGVTVVAVDGGTAR